MNGQRRKILHSVKKLLGEYPTPELIGEIEDIIAKLHTGDLSPHHYHFHDYVSQKELSFHIKLNSNKSIQEGHAIASAIERSIYDKLRISTTIHIDPIFLTIHNNHHTVYNRKEAKPIQHPKFGKRTK